MSALDGGVVPSVTADLTNFRILGSDSGLTLPITTARPVGMLSVFLPMSAISARYNNRA